jgi:hypothetical protein
VETKLQNLLTKRFGELSKVVDDLESNSRGGTTHSDEVVDNEAVLNWKVKAKSLLLSACGEGSIHVAEFGKAETYSGWSMFHNLRRMKQVFAAAKEDYEGGYLSSTRTIVQAEVFSSELDQASELLGKGYKTPAAVIAGAVLETGLRELCDRNKIACGKLDRMNADLAKAGVYTVLVQKRITTLADIRNNAAHGHPDQFNDADVKAMIAEAERFLADYLT